MSTSQLGGEVSEAYRRIRPQYEEFCVDVERTIKSILQDHKISIHSINARAKDIDSYARKANKRDKNGSPKYNKPLTEITDLAAARVIAYTQSAVDEICSAIEASFDIFSKEDIGEERAESADFGYKSVHYLIRYSSDRVKLRDFRKYSGLICEIQVRTILQHAWAELEHDIQYKNEVEIPKEIRRRFRALAGLLEIADREFAIIQEIEAKLRTEVQRSAVSDLTQLSLIEVGSDRTSVDVVSDIARVRDLVSKGAYAEALVLYDRAIVDHPNSYTHYLGRAKVRFLLNDRTGALEDIKIAEQIAPNGQGIQQLRQQIETGTVLVRESDQEHLESLRSANSALADGNAELAFQKYIEAQERGFNPHFARLNQAMACVLADDARGARALIADLRRIPDTPMEINLCAMDCLINSSLDEDISGNIMTLRTLLGQKPDFSLRLSPLRYLKEGLVKRNDNLPVNFESVFKILETPLDQ
jgi:ppGpp synthetase/RelA/SpoT-type nucleotidyltranferase